MTFENMSIFSSTVLFYMTIFVTLVTLFRITKVRTWPLVGLAILLLGIDAREFVVVHNGPGYWSEFWFGVAAVSRWIQIIGASVLIWALTTTPRFKNWAWMVWLTVSIGIAVLLKV